jgi:protein-arginine kinase activator protein McsA
MTNSQRELFSKILDINWELKEAVDNEKYFQAVSLKDQLDEFIEELKESMGVEAFDTFMSNGRKMFA